MMETWPYRSENVPSGCILVNIDGEPVWVRESAWSGAGGTLRDDELVMAVIEAAKALVHEQRHGDPSSVAAAEWAQAKAVDELLATEKGE